MYSLTNISLPTLALSRSGSWVQDEYTSSQPVQLPAPHSVVGVSLLRGNTIVKKNNFLMLISSQVFHTLSTKFLGLYTFCLLKTVLTACYNVFTSKHDTDLFQIIQSVKMAFVQKRIRISRRISQRFSI